MNASIVSNRYCAEHLGGHGYKIIDTVTGQSVTPEQVYTTATELAPGVFFVEFNESRSLQEGLMTITWQAGAHRSQFFEGRYEILQDVNKLNTCLVLCADDFDCNEKILLINRATGRILLKFSGKIKTLGQDLFLVTICDDTEEGVCGLYDATSESFLIQPKYLPDAFSTHDGLMIFFRVNETIFFNIQSREYLLCITTTSDGGDSTHTVRCVQKTALVDGETGEAVWGTI